MTDDDDPTEERTDDGRPDARVYGVSASDRGERHGVYGDTDATGGYGLYTPSDARVGGRLEAGSVSVERFSLSPAYVVYRRAGAVRALDGATGTESVRATTAAAAFEEVFDRLSGGATVAVRPGVYEFDAGITLPYGCRVVGGGVDTVFRVADGAAVPSLVTVPAGHDFACVANCRLDGAGVDGGVTGIHLRGGTYAPRLANLVVEDFSGFGVAADADDGPVHEAVMENVQVQRCGTAGINLGDYHDAFHRNVYVQDSDAGIKDFGSGNTWVHPHVYRNGRWGMVVSEYSNDATLVAAHAENNGDHGLLVRGDRTEVVGATVWNNGQDAPGERDGLFVDAPATATTVLGGHFFDRQGADATQRRGVADHPDATGTVIAHARTAGNAAGGVDLAGEGSTHNGVATEDLGTEPTAPPTGSYPEGTTVRTTAPDGDAAWRLIDGTWVRIA